jgi:hypothetical protein
MVERFLEQAWIYEHINGFAVLKRDLDAPLAVARKTGCGVPGGALLLSLSASGRDQEHRGDQQGRKEQPLSRCHGILLGRKNKVTNRTDERTGKIGRNTAARAEQVRLPAGAIMRSIAYVERNVPETESGTLSIA